MSPRSRDNIVVLFKKGGKKTLTRNYHFFLPVNTSCIMYRTHKYFRRVRRGRRFLSSSHHRQIIGI